MKSFVVVALLIACVLGDGNVTFTPGDLPCAFSVRSDGMLRFTADGQTETQYTQYVLFVDGDNLHFINVDRDSNSTVRQEKAIRADQAETLSGEVYYPVYSASTRDKVCSVEHVPKSAAKNLIADELDLFTKEQVFINVTDTEYDGIPCKMYFDFTDRDGSMSTRTLYADKNNYIIALIVQTDVDDGSFSSTQSLNITYDFDVQMRYFAINRTVFSNCSDDAYTDATEQCGAYSSGASSVSSSSEPSDSSFDSSSSSTTSSTKPKSESKSESSASSTQTAIFVLLAALAIALL